MGAILTATVLVENTPVAGLAAEHGLSVHLCYEREGRATRILLDVGQSDAFARNATALDVDLAAVDCAVLSHAHYDHANGLPAFCVANASAPVYLSEACAETCWSTKAGTTEPHYIGPTPGLLERFGQRLVRVSTGRLTTIAPGVHLVPHTTPDLAAAGERAGMLLRTRDGWIPDDFAHETSLVVELAPAPDDMPQLVVFNSCSHAGLPVIAAEAAAAFPGARIAAYVGGLHLVHATDDEIALAAAAISDAGIGHVYTGHCTGTHALRLLQHALPGRVTGLHPGMTFTC